MEVNQELEKNGYYWEMLPSDAPKATYYKPNGEPMPNLPADARSMKNYLSKGFSLTPPKGE